MFHKSDNHGFQFGAKLSTDLRGHAVTAEVAVVVCTSALALESMRILVRIGFSTACEGTISTGGIEFRPTPAYLCRLFRELIVFSVLYEAMLVSL